MEVKRMIRDISNQVLLSLFVFISLGTASPIDRSSAEIVARSKLTELRIDSEFTLRRDEIEIRDDHGQTLAFVFNLAPTGFMIIAGDDRLPPVISYSFDTDFHNPDGVMNPLQNLVKRDLTKRLEHVRQIDDTTIRKNKKLWDLYRSGDIPKGSRRESYQWPPAGVSPTGGWVRSRWTQDPPYNNLCPIDPTTNLRSLAGCPAVAMGQILNYHRSINETHFDDNDDYFHNYAGQYWIDDDHAEHGFPSFPELNVYLDTLTVHYQSGTPVTNTDKAALVFACGVAAEQVYSSGGSGTFGVDQALQAYMRMGENDVGFYAGGPPVLYHRLSLNMIDALPAHLAVVTPQWNAGHNLVVDGYNTDGYYHLNFGWGGFADAWYDLPDELPYNLTVIEGLIFDIASASIYPDGTDVPSNATLLGLPVDDTSYTIFPPGDEDWFVFYSEGSVDLSIYSEEVSGCEFDPFFRLYGPHEADGSDVDPEVSIASDDNTHGSMQPEINFTTGGSGYYFLHVSRSEDASGEFDTGAYLLNVAVMAGLAPPVNLSVEVDGNDVLLIWEPPPEGAKDFIGYNVYRDQQILNIDPLTSMEFSDLNVADGEYTYFVTAVYQGGESGSSNEVSVTVPSVSSEENNPEQPSVTRLLASYPNPTKEAVQISYELASHGDVTVSIFDITGRIIRTLINGRKDSGIHTISWDCKDNGGQQIPTGLYVINMTTKDYIKQKPLVVLR